jgi:hypothetical protein
MWRGGEGPADVERVTIGAGARRGRGRAGVVVVAAAMLGALAGCKARHGYQGSDGEVLAGYGVRKLRTELPARVRVQAVVAAADAALRDRGYAVKTAHATEDLGRVVAEPPGAGPLQSVVVTAEVVPDATRVEVLLKPWGDEARSRAILDGILVRLGM